MAFAAPYPGKILPMDLSRARRRSSICQKDSFLCAATGVSIGIAFQKKIGVGLFGGEGFIMQRLEGDGWVFVHAGGTLVERELARGRDAARRHRLPRRLHARRRLRRDRPRAACAAALFGGEGLFFARLTRAGPGLAAVAALRAPGRADACGGR